MQTGAISGDELTRIQNVYASALANLNAAKAAVAQADAAKQAAVGARQANAVLIENADTETNPEVVLARAKRDQARLDLERTVIRSPVDGVVARRRRAWATCTTFHTVIVRGASTANSRQCQLQGGSTPACESGAESGAGKRSVWR